MKRHLITLLSAAALIFSTFLFVGSASAETCFNCAKDSTSSCSGKQQCRGNRKDCRKKGCKITGTSSCSSAANVKKCEAPLVPEHDSFASYPAAETCLMCAGNSTGGCAGAKQCRGTRKDCKARGCKITGTASCSKAANVKICKSYGGQTAQAAIAWCSY